MMALKENVLQAIRSIRHQGLGAELDVESAYRLLPVHSEDRPLLGMQWRGKCYIDTALPFGLRSAPMIFNVVADAMQWIFEQNGVQNYSLPG